MQQLLALRQELRDPAALEVHLVNVQRPVTGNVASFVSPDSLEEYHRERSQAALAPARAALGAAGVAFVEHQRMGPPGPTIAEVAQQQNCDLIVMGTQGLRSNTGALLGSVAQNVIEHAAVPVLVVR